MEWNTNNKACVSVWFYLKGTKQLKSKFANSETKRMDSLRFWNPTSTEATYAKAEAWAEWYISYITSKDGARYEKGNSWSSTISSMVKVMTVADNTVKDLAETVDNSVLFFEEVA